MCCAQDNTDHLSTFAEGCEHHRNKKNTVSNFHFNFHFNSYFKTLYYL